jgi:uncharacterized MAPEG superfamily protein
MLSHIQVWALFVVFAFFKMLSNSLMQGWSRYTNRSFRYPEDQRGVFGNETIKPEAELGVRATALWRNDLENFLPFAMLALAGAFVEASYDAYCWVVFLFAVSRVGHAWFMVRPKQPHRMLFYYSGQFCGLAMIGLILWRIYIP